MDLLKYRYVNIKRLMIKCINKDRLDLVAILIEISHQIGDETIGEQSQYGSIKTIVSNLEYVIKEA